jgi:hypothetical protein
VSERAPGELPPKAERQPDGSVVLYRRRRRVAPKTIASESVHLTQAEASAVYLVVTGWAP